MIVHIDNPYEAMKSEDVAMKFVGQRLFFGWPFLQEGKVVAVSDSLFKYEKLAVVPGHPPKIVSTPHAPAGLGHWANKSERIEQGYSKKCGVITGGIKMLLHIRPLKGLKRLESGALIKDYEGPEKETEQGVQMCLQEVHSEDPRYLERDPPPLSEEFPEGSKVFFLGEHAFGVAAQVSATTDKSLSVILAFFPAEKTEIDKFKDIVQSRKAGRYFPSFRVAEMAGLSGRALGKITSSFLVLTSDQQKTNLGLSLKFEGKSMKVIDYTRKDGRFWEYSDKAVELIKNYVAAFPDLFASLDRGGDAIARATDIFPNGDADARVKEIKAWLKAKGVRDLEAVSLFCDQLSKDTIMEIEQLEDTITKSKSSSQIKKAIVKGIPRQAVLKPAHAVYRLQNQYFALGDRVTMVQDSGIVPLAVKGVVVGLNAQSMDVVWDVPFISGSNLNARCSQYRGSTVPFNSCLNLTNQQFVTSTNPQAPPPVRNQVPFKPKFGPHPVIQPRPGQASAAGFRPATQTNGQTGPVKIMANPNRGRGGYVNGRGGPPAQNPPAPPANANDWSPATTSASRGRGVGRGRGGPPNPSFRGGGRGFDRGRGGGGGRGFRGRGRGTFPAPGAAVPS
ncbi:hypothetical protein FA15DRAFT_585426 [Coprinopsis marcescibilis]|uniref:Uncharacterized protein n=1 Tax=Coprinopsis marcescibilis TaxID=230819 RepID=A0A5C3L5E2_COPMA|nr:hypothetical protein FA15DRAFT_585426 [Coprinopsis marcescibilis]